MKLHEIINSRDGNIRLDIAVKNYKRSIDILYQRYKGCAPYYMVAHDSFGCVFGRIVFKDELELEIANYLGFDFFNMHNASSNLLRQYHEIWAQSIEFNLNLN
jgi:hypothetical protein